MSPYSIALLFAFAIGVIAGLRSLTAPADTAWAAHLGWLHVVGTPFKFMSSVIAVAIFTILAIVELITDKLPTTPSRLAPPGLGARIVMGGLSGATVAAAGGQSWIVGAILGALGGVVGAWAGYQVRSRLVRQLKCPDFVIAVAEDLVAICGGLLLLSRF
jgi:uncharacterized membrane protein